MCNFSKIWYLLIINFIFIINVDAETKVDYYSTFPKELGPKSFNQKTVDYFKQNNDDMFLDGFRAHEKFHSSRLQLSYFMQQSGEFYGKYLLVNHLNHTMNFDLYIFLDYEQQIFQVSKVKVNVYPITLNKESEKLIPIKLNKISNGVHDILILAVRTKAEGKFYDPGFTFLSHRANIYVNKSSMKNVKYSKLTHSTPFKFADIWITNTRNSNKNQTGNTQKYNIHVSNNNRKKTKFSLIVLLNSKQIFLSPKSLKKSYYYEQDKSSSNSIPIHISKKYEANKLLAIIIENPYSILEPNRSIYEVNSSQIRISNLYNTFSDRI